MDFVYHIIIGTAILAASPFILLKMIINPRFRTDTLSRLRGGTRVPELSGCVWVHASSVGEVRAAKILIRVLKEHVKNLPIVLSTFTAMGYEQAVKEGVDHVFRLPPDFPYWIHPLFDKLNPKILILIEAEFWPCLLRRCKYLGVPSILVNGRITERAASSYEKSQQVFRWITQGIAKFSMRTEADAERILKLGIDPAKVTVNGNIKFDALPGQSKEIPEPDEQSDSNSKLVVFGSTRPGDEGPAMQAIVDLRKKIPGLRFVIAPRHVQRCREVEDLIKEFDMDYVLHSQLGKNLDWNRELILLDTLGELNGYYARAAAAFVGGGLNPRFGGHNILEPAGYSIPVVFGKHMNNFEEEARLLLQSGGGIQIDRPKELYETLHKLMTDPQERQRIGNAAGKTVRQNRGAVERNLNLILALLN